MASQQPAVSQAVASTGCGADPQCICSHSSFFALIMGSMWQSCSPADVQSEHSTVPSGLAREAKTDLLMALCRNRDSPYSALPQTERQSKLQGHRQRFRHLCARNRLSDPALNIKKDRQSEALVGRLPDRTCDGMNVLGRGIHSLHDEHFCLRDCSSLE